MAGLVSSHPDRRHAQGAVKRLRGVGDEMHEVQPAVGEGDLAGGMQVRHAGDKPPMSRRNRMSRIEMESSSLRRKSHLWEAPPALPVSHEAERCATLRALVAAHSSFAAA
eukprot:CAMPEP_0180384454 /NCGR_PEP_ID=MMETSP0989-20121125/28541_1 /TAXON_ID=697907 /ORGANISM="non described non described, Strain CCMP2293" /LENGTH=109 /DNA_ID=CAMNT_0022384905 /DNA_START=89 /DNA_END=415 /DNA_ORIENTATION=-